VTYDPDDGQEGDPKVSFRLPTWDLDALDRLAAETGLSRSDLLRTAVAWTLRAHPRPQPTFDLSDIEASEAITIAEHLRVIQQEDSSYNPPIAG